MHNIATNMTTAKTIRFLPGFMKSKFTAPGQINSYETVVYWMLNCQAGNTTGMVFSPTENTWGTGSSPPEKNIWWIRRPVSAASVGVNHGLS